jgi:hypothetical protein
MLSSNSSNMIFVDEVAIMMYAYTHTLNSLQNKGIMSTQSCYSLINADFSFFSWDRLYQIQPFQDQIL